jgi:hypothetical protein
MKYGRVKGPIDERHITKLYYSPTENSHPLKPN